VAWWPIGNAGAGAAKAAPAAPSARRRLRASLDSGAFVLAPFVYDGLQARLAEDAGFEAVYMTGFGTAAGQGLPDLGLLTQSEMVANVRTLARSVSVPVLCDADTGYGNALNVARTVVEYEDAGAAALHIEDQVWPKRCGFLEGKQVIPLQEMLPKVRAALDARRDPDLVIIARTDALQPAGWDEAERRARAYREAGADLVFVDGIRSVEDLDVYARRLADLPRLYNGQLLTPDEIQARGFRVMIHTATLAAAFAALRSAFRELRETGRVAASEDPAVFAEVLQVLRVPQMLGWARRYEE
jgi:2-methylisocitrate lyase-like PEP mutase family enzyme